MVRHLVVAAVALFIGACSSPGGLADRPARIDVYPPAIGVMPGPWTIAANGEIIHAPSGTVCGPQTLDGWSIAKVSSSTVPGEADSCIVAGFGAALGVFVTKRPDAVLDTELKILQAEVAANYERVQPGPEIRSHITPDMGVEWSAQKSYLGYVAGKGYVYVMRRIAKVGPWFITLRSTSNPVELASTNINPMSPPDALKSAANDIEAMASYRFLMAVGSAAAHDRAMSK